MIIKKIQNGYEVFFKLKGIKVSFKAENYKEACEKASILLS